MNRVQKCSPFVTQSHTAMDQLFLVFKNCSTGLIVIPPSQLSEPAHKWECTTPAGVCDGCRSFRGEVQEYIRAAKKMLA